VETGGGMIARDGLPCAPAFRGEDELVAPVGLQPSRESTDIATILVSA
jgi:hypothetical protein